MDNFLKKICVILICIVSISSLSGCTLDELSYVYDAYVLSDDYGKGTSDESEEQKIPDEAAISTNPPDVDSSNVDSSNVDSSNDMEQSFLMEEASDYAYNSLDEDSKIWYRDIENILGEMQKDVKLSSEGVKAGLNEDDIDRIFQCVLLDHPEIFYVEGYSYDKYLMGDKLVAINFSGAYNQDTVSAENKKMQINAAAEEILSGADSDWDDYEKIKYVYETLIKNTDYELNAPDNQNIYSVFVNHKSVCLGYAKATQFLLLKLGIECSVVQGMVNDGESHAWNIVKSDGDYYFVDTTWGDASYQNSEEEGSAYLDGMINYDYLCVTTAQLCRTHVISAYIEPEVCTAMNDNYYFREDTLFYNYDEEKIKNIFEKAYEEGRDDITVKCFDNECFQVMKEELIDNQHIFDCMPNEVREVSYANNAKQLSLTFWLY